MSTLTGADRDLRDRLVPVVMGARAAVARATAWQTNATSAEANRYRRHAKAHALRARRATRLYLDSLPRVRLARSPVDDSVVTRTIDTAGLDGPFWHMDAPARPDEPGDGHVLTWMGSMQQPGDAPAAGFARAPGPERPFVVPSLLAHDRVRAVVRGLRIGDQEAHVVTYFGHNFVDPRARPPVWGTWTCPRVSVSRLTRFDAVPLSGLDADFDLAPWIDAGKLFWHAPDDDGLALHDTSDDCPYLDVHGRTDFAVLDPDGATTWRPLLPRSVPIPAVTP